VIRLSMTKVIHGLPAIIFLHQPPNALRPLLGGMIIHYVDATPVLEGGIKRQQMGDAIPFVFHVVAFALPPPGLAGIRSRASRAHCSLVSSIRTTG